MKKISFLVLFLPLLTGCESSIKANYETIKAQKVILVSEDGKEFLLTIKNDSLGNPFLGIQEIKP